MVAARVGPVFHLRNAGLGRGREDAVHRSCAEVAALSTAERGSRKLKQPRVHPTPRELFDVLATSEMLART